MAQKPMQREEVQARALRASQNVKRAEVWVGAMRLVGGRGVGVNEVVEIVLGEHLSRPTRRYSASLGRGRKLEVVQGTVYIFRPGRP
jgi:hypothetical protein